MPINRCKCPNGRPGFRWGGLRCYPYTPGDAQSRKAAFERATTQGRAVQSGLRQDAYGRLAEDIPKRLVLRLRRVYDKRQKRALKLIKAAVKARLGLRIDAVVENATEINAEQVFKALMRGLKTTTPKEQAELRRIAEESIQHAQMASTKRLAGVYGRPVPEWWGMTAEDQVAALDEFVAWNTDLLVDVTEKFGEQVRNEIINAAAGTTTEEALAADLMERYAVSQSRANVISHDQVTKLIRGVEHKRHETLGFTSFIWRSVGDGQVRPDHVSLEGKEFTYKNPPSEGLPGQPVNCRCYEEPVLGDDLALPPLKGPNFTNPPGGNPPWEN